MTELRRGHWGGPNATSGRLYKMGKLGHRHMQAGRMPEEDWSSATTRSQDRGLGRPSLETSAGITMPTTPTLSSHSEALQNSEWTGPPHPSKGVSDPGSFCPPVNMHPLWPWGSLSQNPAPEVCTKHTDVDQQEYQLWPCV